MEKTRGRKSRATVPLNVGFGRRLNSVVFAQIIYGIGLVFDMVGMLILLKAALLYYVIGERNSLLLIRTHF
jgi:hypothetical protein